MNTNPTRILSVLAVAALSLRATPAKAGGTAFGISVDLGGIGWAVSSCRGSTYVSAYAAAPVYYAPQPVVYQPAPVYYAPQPVVYQPAPVYYAPQPVVYRPAPVYYAPFRPLYCPPRQIHHAPPRSVHCASPVATPHHGYRGGYDGGPHGGRR